MHLWQNSKIIAGKDLQAGGTWLGINPQGRFAALTNYRDLTMANKGIYSRGKLVVDALQQNDQQMTDYLLSHHQEYDGFNLIFGDLEQLTVYSQIDNTFKTLNEGFHSVCNGKLDDIWPKMAKGQQALESYIEENTSLNHNSLFTLMQDAQTAPDEQLPSTGLDYPWEKQLSAIFINPITSPKEKNKDYGTRSTSILTLTSDQLLTISERSFGLDGSTSPIATFEQKFGN